MLSTYRKSQGYTLVELVLFILLSIVFVQILIMVVDPLDRIKERQDQTAMRDIKSVGSALEEYIAKHGRFISHGENAQSDSGFRIAVEQLYMDGIITSRVISPPSENYSYHYISQYNGLDCSGRDQFCNYSVVWVSGLQSKQFGENTFYYYDPSTGKGCTSSKPPYDNENRSIIPCLKPSQAQ